MAADAGAQAGQRARRRGREDEDEDEGMQESGMCVVVSARLETKLTFWALDRDMDHETDADMTQRKPVPQWGAGLTA